jgi:hypothetical protein
MTAIEGSTLNGLGLKAVEARLENLLAGDLLPVLGRIVGLLLLF